MNKRAFIAALGGVAAWPMVARGQGSYSQKTLPRYGKVL